MPRTTARCLQSVKKVLSQRNSEPSIPWYFSLSNILRQSLPVSFYFKNSLGFQNSRKLLCSCVTERHYTIITFALIGQHTAASRWVLTLEKKNTGKQCLRRFTWDRKLLLICSWVDIITLVCLIEKTIVIGITCKKFNAMKSSSKWKFSFLLLIRNFYGLEVVPIDFQSAVEQVV